LVRGDKKILTSILACVALLCMPVNAFGSCFLIGPGSLLVLLHVDQDGWWSRMPASYLYMALAFLVMFALVLAGFRARRQNARRRETEKNSLQQQLLQSEMRALRSQMNPHFIFNAINSIQHYVLINEKELANKYLVKFSRLMRNILDLSKEELITLKEELETVRLYLEIEALRFNNAFNFNISCAPDVDADKIRLPPLLIQPFVENAIWHGLLLKDGDKVLNIEIKKDVHGIGIRIEDNGIGRRNAEKFRNREFDRKSLGMEITQVRLDVVRKAHQIAISYDVIDKMSATGLAEGTTVLVKLHQQKEI
jgi:LytS/YehU family sensor histidine kinase